MLANTLLFAGVTVFVVCLLLMEWSVILRWQQENIAQVVLTSLFNL